jgi:hypothetical protein
VISGFRREANEICASLGYCAAYGGNSLPTFRDNLTVPSSRVKKSKKDFFALEDETDLDLLTFEEGIDTLYRNVGK